VGIGTDNPSEKLSVYGAVESLYDTIGEGGQFILRGKTGTPIRWNIDNYSVGVTTNLFRIFKEDNSTAGANGRVYVGITTIGEFIIGDDAGALSPTGTANQQLQVQSGAYVSGNLGLGITNPTSKLQVAGNVTPSVTNSYDLGSIDLKWKDIHATTFNGAFQGNADTATILATARNFSIDGNNNTSINAGDVSAATVSFDGSSNVILRGSLKNVTGLSAGTYGNSITVPVVSVNSQGIVTSITSVGVNFSTATVANADKVAAVTISTDATHYLTFVDSDNNPAAYESLYTDAGISYNAFTNLLTVPNTKFNSIKDSTGSSGSAGSILRSNGTNLFWDTTSLINPLYKGTVVRGYTLGGYQNSVAYNTVYKTIHSTDTTTNLGGILSYYNAYTAAASSGTFAYDFNANATSPHLASGNGINK
jgi:hypothetical protein